LVVILLFYLFAPAVFTCFLTSSHSIPLYFSFSSFCNSYCATTSSPTHTSSETMY
jgi:hypothetical protein